MFSRSTELQYGLVTILTASGEVRVEVKEPKGMMGEVLGQITSLLPDLSRADTGSIRALLQSRLNAESAAVVAD
jgi:hypothetical protein